MGPYKCPECGIWWAGLEHRCSPPGPSVTTNPIINTFTVRCTCSFDPKGRRIPNTVTCPVHDVSVTYTTGTANGYGMGVVLRTDTLGRLT